MSTSTKSKTTKTTNAKATKKPAAKVPAAKVPAVTASTKVAFLSPRPGSKDSPKSRLLALVPRKGAIAFKALAAKAEAEGLKADRVAGWVGSLAAYKRVELRA